MATATVRVRLWPDRDIEVDEAEIPNLRQQGLLIENQPEPESQPDAEKPARGGKSSKETAS